MKKTHKGAFAGLQVYVSPRIRNRNARVKVWQKRLSLGGGELQDALGPTTTHAVTDVEDGHLSTLTDVQVVSPEWLQDTLMSGAVQDASDYAGVQLHVHEPAPANTVHTHLTRKEEVLKRWLGFWSDDFSHDGRGLLHLMVQATYSNARCKELQNHVLMAALVEMTKIENAIDGLSDDDDFAARALKYARVAAAVQACSYTIDSALQAGDLPYVGDAIAAQIRDVCKTGTCTQLEQMRRNVPVSSSSGGARSGTEGAAARAQFCRLPGVGKKMAQNWFALGLRTFEDLEAACQPDGAFGGHFSNSTMTREAHFSLMHRHELLGEDMAEETIEEMEAAVHAALRTAEGEGWTVARAGGAARGRSSHDCDFVITCHGSTRPAQGAVKTVVEALLHSDRLWPKGHALFRMQADRMPGHIHRMKNHLLTVGQDGGEHHNLSMDRFDRFFGMFKTESGKAKRLDLIFVPYEELGFGYLGWVGSRQYLRFLRQFARDCCHSATIKSSMHLNSHGLLVKRGAEVWQVPQEGPPLNWNNGEAEWPPGWNQGRIVKCEEDVFELVRVPYRAPQERNCP